MKTADTAISPPPEVSCAASAAVGPPTQTGGGSSSAIDLTGQQFGRWTVLRKASPGHLNDPRWHVRCACGVQKIVRARHLKSGMSQSCGCLNRERTSKRNLHPLTGLRFGKLIVGVRRGNGKGGRPRWQVFCDCGVETTVLGESLVSGNTTSCGCKRRETSSKLFLKDITGKTFGRLTVLSRALNKPGRATRWNTRCTCGNEQVVCGSNLKRGHTTSCGCFAREQRKSRIGAKSPRWSPSLSDEDRARRRLGSATGRWMQHISQQIRSRDRATCLVCGAPQSTHVHHLEPWALNRDLRYDPANLVTLCKECHDQFHYLYGKDAGLDEFEEYLEP